MSELVQFVGSPDGPKIFVPELGLDVGTFEAEPGGNWPALYYHVPLNSRGPYRPDQLANYDSTHQYRTDAFGFVLCDKVLPDGDNAATRLCRKRSANRYPKCNMHGGRLHPLDKIITDTGQDEPEATEQLSRYQMYLAKQITVDDLDNEELLAFGFRTATGRIFKPKNITREMANGFTRAIFDRSLDKLKGSALDAANTLSSLMLDDSVDASIRLRAACEILDRTIGKAPLQVTINPGSAFDQVFENLFTGGRDASRAERGYIEGEVVSDDDPLALGPGQDSPEA